MISRVKALFQAFSKHRYGFTLVAYLTAAVLTGLGCVLFMWAFEFVLSHRLDWNSIGWLSYLSTPLLLLLAVELIRRAAPCADGTGIPQVICAVEHLSPKTEQALAPLTSPRTMIIKIAAILIALLAGASTGREGPTVHIAACIFIGILMLFRRITGFEFDLPSAAVAGGAAGLAAAFNTPLAGITFAIEELSINYFADVKDFVIMAIVVSAIAAQSMYGEFNYFGKLLEPQGIPLYAVLLIGLAGGLLGASFSTAILEGKAFLSRRQQSWRRYVIPIMLAVALVVVARLMSSDVLGPGNKIAQFLTQGNYAKWVPVFPAGKLLATLLTYWSGIAGGIFAPSLSIGAGLGASIGNWLGVSTASCALIGMAAFLSATIQAPITAFVIIFEMTGHHQMLVPIMLASVVAFMVARLLGAKHLYQSLSTNYQFLLASEKS